LTHAVITHPKLISCV